VTELLMPRRRRAPFLAVLLALAGSVIVSRPVVAQFNYDLFKDPANRFTLEYPREWFWQLIPGVGDLLAAFTEKRGEAALIIERFQLQQAVSPGDMTDLFAQLELDALKQKQPKASNFVSRLMDMPGRKIVVIDYSRPGLLGPELARQYSYPVEASLYRLTCSAPQPFFGKYDAAFVHIAQTFKVTAASPMH
jgi:hypothetical protein